MAPSLPPDMPPSPVAAQTPSDDRLPLPDEVVPGQLVWPYAIVLGLFHLIALFAFVPWLFTWTAVITMIVGVGVFGQGINLCYHRLLTHKSFVVPPWLERFFVLIALCCLEDTPGKWVAIHRYHHEYSDRQPDPHTPRVSFFWAHIGWLITRNPASHRITLYQKYAPDILRNPFYMKLEKSLWWIWVYVAHALLFTAIGMAIGGVVGGDWPTAWRYGASMLVWAVVVRTVVVWHITWSVNSLTHLFGYQRYETGENSRNNWIIGLLAAGEGWHNNHHHDPASASNQHQWWEIDTTWYCIRALEIVGLATKVTRPRSVRHASRTPVGAEARGDNGTEE